MQPSNLLVALSALFLGQAQASPTPEKQLHPKSHITVEFFDGYGKSYTEKVWPDGDEHWFSKSSTTVFAFFIPLLWTVSTDVQHADALTY
jgi:hypothetical protein